MAKGIKINFPFVPMPLEAFDAEKGLKEAGLKLLAYILKHTRFGEAFPELTYDELLHGIVNEKTGRRKDSGCGLSRNGIKNGQAELEDRGWLKVTKTDHRPPRLFYRLVLQPQDDPASAEDSPSPSDAGVSPDDSGTKSDPASVRDTGTSPSETADSQGDSGSVTKSTALSPNDSAYKEVRSTRSLEEVQEEAGERKNGHSRAKRKELTTSDGIHYSRWRSKMELEEKDWQRRNPEAVEMPGRVWAHLAAIAAERSGTPKSALIRILKHETPDDPNVDLIGQQLILGSGDKVEQQLELGATK
ncbi:MAG TPA: hypothetical protein VKY85_07760 [Candidatus Angelobacter sp.]|nr:hypothetical protein [Candidatus Angelobacter sp.]